MAIPTDIICIQKKTWFDSLSMNQLEDLCVAANLHHKGHDKSDLVNTLCNNQISSSFASANVKSIKDMLRSRSLSVTGLKYQLVLRILEHDQKAALAEDMYQGLKIFISSGQSVYNWLAMTMTEIRNGKHSIFVGQTPLAGFRRAQAAFAVLIRNMQYIPNAGIDNSDSLSLAIDELAFILSNAYIFLGTSEKKAAIAWILELELVISEYMLGENSKISLKDLIQLLESGVCPLHKMDERGDHESMDTARQIAQIEFDYSSLRKPHRWLQDHPRKGTNNRNAATTVVVKKKPKQKSLTSKNEIVYRKMATVLRKSGGDSDYVYGKLLHLMRSISSEVDDYEALKLFRSAFLAVIVHFEKIEDPGKDTNHSFKIAIDHLGEVLKAVVGALSSKEKHETLRWMVDLHTLTKPHALGDIAEIPLKELIRMVKNSDPDEKGGTCGRFFLL